MIHRKVCILFPEVNQISGIILFQYVHLLKFLTSDLYIITKNNTVKYSEDAYIPLNPINHEKEVSIAYKIPLFLKMEVKMAYYFFLIREKIEILVLNHTRGSYLFPQSIAKLLGKKIILITGGTPSECISAKSFLSKIFLPTIIFLEIFTYFLADRIVIYSELELEKKPGLRWFRNKVKFSGGRYVDTNIFKNEMPISKRENIIGYVGRLSEEKGIINLIEAIEQINRNNFNLNFLFIGDGPLTQMLQTKLLQKYNNIEYTGLIPQQKLSFYLNKMKILIIPSYTEGLPKILLEAMSCGTPILTTPVGAIPDIIRDSINGFILQDNSPNCIRENIIRVINYQYLDKIVNNAKEVVSDKYTFDKALQRYSDILELL